MPPNFPHRHLTECASTNDEARAWILDTADPAPHGFVVSTDFQTRGRGRRGRQWQAAAGESVLMSAVLRPPFAQSEAWQMAFVAALAVSDAVGAYCTDVMLKWPNDILVQGNKAGGILVETMSLPHAQWAAIVGIGVNVGQASFDSTVHYQVPPTSLRLSCGQVPAVAVLTAQIAQALGERLARHVSEGWSQTRADWQARMAPGVVLTQGELRGVCVGLEADGRARVRLPSGTFALWATVDGTEGALGTPHSV